MSRLDQMDLMVELIELYHELKHEILQQLIYYRASVYKTETSRMIDQKVEQLRMVANLFHNDDIIDHFRDYEATKRNGNVNLSPGECHLSTRLTQLFQNLDDSFQKLHADLQQNRNQYQNSTELAKSVLKHRRQLLALCRQGSRQWSFFQTI